MMLEPVTAVILAFGSIFMLNQPTSSAYRPSQHVHHIPTIPSVPSDEPSPTHCTNGRAPISQAITVWGMLPFSIL